MEKPILIAGPCLAESFTLLDDVAGFLADLVRTLDCTWIFKASFDKANRSSARTHRGPGLENALGWLGQIREKYGCQVLTDVHDVVQIKKVADIVDCIQIPAFLCRQTDLLVAAAETGKVVNVKKGQFLSPYAMSGVVEKVQQALGPKKYDPSRLWLTERGTSFGYGDLVVDPRTFPIMARFGCPVIFDVTHSLQSPPGGNLVSGGQREFASVLARCAVSTGYVDGVFIEVHPNPGSAQSDSSTQLNFQQAKVVIEESIRGIMLSRKNTSYDKIFADLKS